MVDLEQRYRQKLGELTGLQRVGLSAGMLVEVCSMLERRFRLAEPDLSNRELRRRIAAALYRTDPDAQELLRRLEK